MFGFEPSASHHNVFSALVRVAYIAFAQRTISIQSHLFSLHPYFNPLAKPRKILQSNINFAIAKITSDCEHEQTPTFAKATAGKASPAPTGANQNALKK